MKLVFERSRKCSAGLNNRIGHELMKIRILKDRIQAAKLFSGE